MSAYRVAIGQIMEAINRRAKYYRNLIITIVAISVCSLGWAMIAWALSPLAGFLILFPVCSLYFFLDSRLLNDWRSRLFESWIKGEIDFYALGNAVSALSMLPKGTVQSMIATLPSMGDLLTEQGISPSTREAIVVLLTTIHTCRSDAIAFKAAVYTILGGSLIVSVALWMWEPLLVILILTLILLVQKRIKMWRLKDMRERTVAAQQMHDFSHKKYLGFVSHLNWAPIPDSEKDKFLAAMCTTE